jgi:hypothetical protein
MLYSSTFNAQVGLSYNSNMLVLGGFYTAIVYV